jgi:hypothetical protein
LADVKISGLPASTTPLAGTEVLPIVQGGQTRQVANNDLRPKQIQSNATSGVLQIAGPAAAATRVMTTPDANFTAARTDAAQTFTGQQTFGGGISSTGATLTSTGLIVFASEVYNELYSSGGVGNNARVRFRAVYTGGGSGFGGSFQLETRQSNNVYNAGALTVTDTGNVSTTGNVVIATSGKGIDFSATPGTGTSELLADYEEGTWTPTLTATTSGTITVTSPSNSLNYTKIGRLVTLTGRITVTSVSLPLGLLILGGFPFTSGSSTSNNSGAGAVYASGLTTASALSFRIAENATGGIIATPNQGDAAPITQANTEFYINIAYTV